MRMQGSGYLYYLATTKKIWRQYTRIKRDDENTYAILILLIFNTIITGIDLAMEERGNCFKGNRIGAESWIDGFLCSDWRFRICCFDSNDFGALAANMATDGNPIGVFIWILLRSLSWFFVGSNLNLHTKKEFP